MTKAFSILVVTLALVAAAPRRIAAQQPPAALVVKVQGDVTIKHGGASTPAVVGAKLEVGDEVVPAAGAKAYLVQRSGQTQIVSAATKIAAPAAGAPSDAFSRTVQVLASAATSNARSQPNRQGMIRPIPGEPVLVAPRNAIKVSSVRPTFSWMPVEGATGYTLQLRTAGSPPRRFQLGNVTEWTLPAAEAALEPGKQYMWTIAPASGRPTREVTFTVIGDDVRQELAAGLKAISGMGLDPKAEGQLLAAVVFADLGLYYDAADALGRMEKSGDALSPDVYLLKGEVLDALGHLDEARAAFDRADALLRG
jgi:hypothetical protein